MSTDVPLSNPSIQTTNKPGFVCQAVSHKHKTLQTLSVYSRRSFGFNLSIEHSVSYFVLILNSRNWMCMKDGDSGKILWLNQNSDFSKSNIEHEARIPKKILKVGNGRYRAIILIQKMPLVSVPMEYFSAKVFVANSISHLLKKFRHLVLCREYFSSKYKIFIAMNR